MRRREVRFSVTPEEYAEIQAYVESKKRWHRISHFVRDAVYQAMDRYPTRKSLGGTAHDVEGQ